MFWYLWLCSVAERDLVVEGLVNFSFTLLGIGSALGRDPIAEKQWKLGIKILLKLVKRRRQIAPSVLQTLSNRIVTGQNVSQYLGDFISISPRIASLIVNYFRVCLSNEQKHASFNDRKSQLRH